MQSPSSTLSCTLLLSLYLLTALFHGSDPLHIPNSATHMTQNTVATVLFQKGSQSSLPGFQWPLLTSKSGTQEELICSLNTKDQICYTSDLKVAQPQVWRWGGESVGVWIGGVRSCTWLHTLLYLFPGCGFHHAISAWSQPVTDWIQWNCESK